MKKEVKEEKRVYTNEAYGIQVKAYFKDEDKFIACGQYRETELDKQKREADILLTSIDGGYYTLFLKKHIEIKGRGVKRHSENVVFVTERIYEELQKRYNIMCDF